MPLMIAVGRRVSVSSGAIEKTHRKWVEYPIDLSSATFRLKTTGNTDLHPPDSAFGLIHALPHGLLMYGFKYFIGEPKQ